MKPANQLAQIGRLLMAVAMLSVCGVARAQDAGAPPPPPPGPPGHHGRFAPGPMSDDIMGFVGFEAGLGGKTVTGAPFSATFSLKTTQAFADGNQINRNSTGSFARDSQGRTRRDLTLPALGPLGASGQPAPHVVLIDDVVAKSQYILQPEQKVARQTQRPRWSGRARGKPQGEVSVTKNRPNVTTTSLGTQTINGIQAEGTRTTRTIPAGAIGNTNPIVITVERWYSPDLQTVVMLKRSDPRMGETTFQLTNIQRQEPDASLFQVPADYTVRPAGRIGRGGRGPLGPPPYGGPGAPPQE